MMVKVQKENVQYTIDEKELNKYIQEGFHKVEVKTEKAEENVEKKPKAIKKVAE